MGFQVPTAIIMGGTCINNCNALMILCISSAIESTGTSASETVTRTKAKVESFRRLMSQMETPIASTSFAHSGKDKVSVADGSLSSVSGKDLITRKMIGSGRLRDGFYFLDLAITEDDRIKHAHQSGRCDASEEKIWHSIYPISCINPHWSGDHLSSFRRRY